jgi:AraC-like DNA-binding protein
MLRPDPALMTRLLTLHKIVGQLAHDTPDLLEQPEVRRSLEERLIHVMVRCLAEGVGVQTASGAHRHDAVIARFEEFLESNRDRPLYLTEICTAVGVAERTLRARCEAHLGMGPIRFLTLRRMHLVRRALLGAEPSKPTVTSILTDHGFWEFGRFSVVYRTLFGETPSETLRRPAEHAVVDLHRPLSLSAIGFSGRVNWPFERSHIDVALCDVRAGSIATVSRCPRYVRFSSDSDQIADVPTRRIKCAPAGRETACEPQVHPCAENSGHGHRAPEHLWL